MTCKTATPSRTVVRLIIGLVGVVCAGAAWAMPGQALAQPDAPAAPPTWATNLPTRVPVTSRLSLSAEPVGQGVRLTGVLASPDGAPIGGARLAVAIDGRSHGQVTTTGSGAYATTVTGLAAGRHTALVTYAGGVSSGPTTTMAAFVVGPDAAQPPVVTSAAPTTQAAPSRATGTLTLAAKASTDTVATGGWFDVTGTLTAGSTPVPAAPIEVTTSWGDVTVASATDAAGAFSVSVGLPQADAEQAPPSTLTVTVSYPGDGRYAATATQVTLGLQQAVASSAPPPTIASETPAPQAGAVAASASAAPPAADPLALDLAGAARSSAVTLLVLLAGGITAVVGMGIAAWRRNQLLPDERRGFGTDFGQ